MPGWVNFYFRNPAMRTEQVGLTLQADQQITILTAVGERIVEGLIRLRNEAMNRKPKESHLNGLSDFPGLL